MLPHDLGAFLFAEVGAEPGAMPLTALSALARLGLDPWDEAGRLSKLPDPEAVGELVRHLGSVPGAPVADAAASAKRLVALLPGRAGASGSPAAQPTGTSLQAVRRRATMLAVAGALTGAALLLAGHLASAGPGRGAAASRPPAGCVA